MNYKQIIEVLKEIDELNRSFTFKIIVDKRNSFDYKAFENIHFKNINIVIECDYAQYTLKEFLDENRKLDELIKPIINIDLSPLEKYLFIYNIVKNYKPYKENETNKYEARLLKYILNNEYIVCLGYINLLKVLLEKVGIETKILNLCVNTSHDNELSMARHARLLVNIVDKKYNIDGYYIADPTWDHNLSIDLYNYALLPYDIMQREKRLFYLNEIDYLLDIHSFEEFVQKVNIYIDRKKLKKDKKEKSDILIYKELVTIIYQILLELDNLKYQKLNNLFSSIIECNEEKTFIDFLTIIGYYLVTKSNKSISFNVIINAIKEIKSKVYNCDCKTIQYDLEQIIKNNGIPLFLYLRSENNKKQKHKK